MNQNRCLLNVCDSLKNVYFTDEDNVIEELYSPCLKNASKYVRAVGYFRSSVFSLMTEDLLDFAIAGGKICLITSIHFDKDDYDTILSNLGHEILVQELVEMRKNPELVSTTEMLAALVCYGSLEIKIAIRKSGIYHKKKGYFEDVYGHMVLFHGSGNETLTALNPDIDEGSSEEFTVYSTESESWATHGALHHQKIISELNGSNVGSTPIIEIGKLDPDIFNFIKGQDWLDLESHRDSANSRQALLIESWNNKPKPFKIRDHQRDGLKCWKDNANSGILQHATGSGKTITALIPIKKHVENGLPALILVPSRLLLKQWIDEVDQFIEDVSILPVGTGHSRWKNVLHMWLDSKKMVGKKRVTIAIIDSAKTKQFMNNLNSNHNLFVVVDECHRIGAPSYEEICSMTCSKVLGLSATPERFDEGDERVQLLCGPVIHEYNLEDAIKDEHLTEYVYNIHTVNLDSEEEQAYDEIKLEISRQVNKFRDKNGNINFKKLPKSLQLKFIQAKRIIKKANAKTSVCGDIIEQNYVASTKQNWLVYCEDSSQLEAVRIELESRSIEPIYEYWSRAEGASYGDNNDEKVFDFDREGTIESWERTGGILLSIQCLDEGVNIPSISHGIILASSNNSRQFIQRRGRMLRLSPGKDLAYIWDALVVPNQNSDTEFNNYVLGEIKRAETFSKSAHSGNSRRVLVNLKSVLQLNTNRPVLELAEGDFDE
ncbi:MAG: DEAD/DEAH box helicase family protein [archaeon]|nr:DEAD/DEAH box helicase family protein [archaeon]